MPEEPRPPFQEIPVIPEPPKIPDNQMAPPEEPAVYELAKPQASEPVQPNQGKFTRFKHWSTSHKKYSIPAAVLLVIIILGALPFTRYKLLGVVYKKDFLISAYDSTAGTPVSGATVTSGSVTAQTDGSGVAKLRLPVGPHKFTFVKKYYQSKSISTLVPILSKKTTPSFALTATGRQVKVSVVNAIGQKALREVNIAVADINAKTDGSGNATIVLPAAQDQLSATLSLPGFNNAKVKIKISATETAQNNFTLVPAGKIYFLSKRTGTLNIMKANLDGSSAEVAVAGTGSEQVTGTQLIQSPSGKYIALLTKRSTSDPTPQLYIISASDDRLLSVDTGNANFSLYGWIGDNLIYTLTRNDLPAWQPGQNKLKSYSADTGKTTLLDQSSATGDSGAYANEYFLFVGLFKNTVIYSKVWDGFTGQGESLLASKQATLNSIAPSGANHKALANYPAVDSLQLVQNGPGTVNLWSQETATSASHFFSYSVGDDGVKAIGEMTSGQFYSGTYGYFLSSDQTRDLWSDYRDGKTVIIVGDSLGAGSSNLTALGDYIPYGWYGTDYVLLVKSSSELYIGATTGGDIVKVTDFQPTTVF